MSKASGGTRNYNGTSTYSKRKDEFGSLMSSGDYNEGYISKSGGFYVIHNKHNEINHKNDDYSNVAAKKLAQRGYKVYLDSEENFMLETPIADGRVYKRKVDFKTVSTVGSNTIKGAIEKASKQGAEVAVLYQRTKKMDRAYVEKQLDLFRLKSPKKAREKIKEVIVVGLSGNVHRHKM